MARPPPPATGAGELELAIPEQDALEPEVSIVVPALNEALTIGSFVDWCKEGLLNANVQGEILIVDSSSDDTGALALAHGARVLRAPKRGLGRAYIDSLPFIRGKYVVLGDSDCTYDFREIAPFIEKLREGAQFVMGSRFRGTIEDGAMPALHRYLGTPVTTWILNAMFSSHFTDIHCGMRGLTRDALFEMRLSSQSWEYASEMVLKSVHMGLVTAEVPIRFLKDTGGRQSHHKRAGWLSPWAAGWSNLRAMFVYGAAFFLYRPGLVLTALGLSMTLPLTLGPLTLAGHMLSLPCMLLGLAFSTLGLECTFLGILAQVFFDYSGRATSKWLARFAYNRSVAIAGGLFLAGLPLCGAFVATRVGSPWTLARAASVEHLGVLGLLLMVAGFTLFTFTLLLHGAVVATWRRP